MEKFDVVIIGGGPAGLSVAKILSGGGKRVAIFEKKQKIGPKICAGGLTLKSLKLGIPISLAEKVFYSLKIQAFGKVIEIKRNQPFVATVSREKLGQWIADQIKENTQIRLNSEVKEIKNNSLFLKSGEEIGFDYLIGADGSLSLTRRHLKVPTKKIWLAMQYILPKAFENLEIFFDPKLFGPGYLWIFPHKDYTSIGCGSDLRFLKMDELKKNFHSWLRERNIDVNNSKLEVWPINFDYRGFNFGNKFLVGDAGGFASGLTGEGIYFAIVSGQEIAKKILNPNYNLSELKGILRLKLGQEKIGKALIFKILRNEFLTKLFFRRFI